MDCDDIVFSDRTDAQIGFLRTVPWNLEGFGIDDNRLRVAYGDGRVGSWFSRLWPKITSEHIKPHDKSPNAALAVRPTSL